MTKQKPQFGSLPNLGHPSRTGLSLGLPMLGAGDLQDYSLNGNSGTNNGATWTSGEHGTALSFDGASSDYVDVGMSDFDGTSGMTAIVKVKVASLPSFQVAISQYQTAGNMRVWQMYGTATTMNAFVSPTGIFNSAYLASASNAIAIGEWVTFAMVFKPGLLVLYKNGIAVASKSIATMFSASTPIYIGAAGIGGVPANFLDGDVEYSHLYNRSLSAQEIKEQYDNPWADYSRTLWAAIQGGVPPVTGSVNLLDGLFARKRLIA